MSECHKISQLECILWSHGGCFIFKLDKCEIYYYVYPRQQLNVRETAEYPGTRCLQPSSIFHSSRKSCASRIKYSKISLFTCLFIYNDTRGCLSTFISSTWKQVSITVGCVPPTCHRYLWWLPLSVSGWGVWSPCEQTPVKILPSRNETQAKSIDFPLQLQISTRFFIILV